MNYRLRHLNMFINVRVLPAFFCYSFSLFFFSTCLIYRDGCLGGKAPKRQRQQQRETRLASTSLY